VLRHAGAGLFVTSALGGVAAAKKGGRGKSGTAGRPTLVASAPDCGTLRVEYVRGNPPVQVFVDGPETMRTRLDDGRRVATWDVNRGEYTVTAKPGNGGSKGNPAVVVEGSPVAVEACESSQPDERPQRLTAAFQCAASTDVAKGTYAVSNPTDADATVDLVLSSDGTRFRFQYAAPAGSTTTVPPDSELVADGTWTHELSATVDGETVPVNGESPWTNSPDCS
jgi:hypothetical protein